MPRLPIRALSRPRIPLSAARTPLRPAPAVPRPTPAQRLQISLFGLFSTTATMSAPKVQKADSEWIAQLSPEQFRILRQKGTEMPGSHEYDHKFDAGTYYCAGCDAPLYKSTTKFDSGCGWPAYFDSIPGAVTRQADNSGGRQRTEIVCTNCHVFKGEGYKTPTDERHCVNGISLNFKEDEGK